MNVAATSYISLDGNENMSLQIGGNFLQLNGKEAYLLLNVPL